MVRKTTKKKSNRKKIYGLYRADFKPPVVEPFYILASDKDDAYGLASKVLSSEGWINVRPHISVVRRITEDEYDRLFDKGTYRGRVIIDESGW